jgi:hypothetical protein
VVLLFCGAKFCERGFWIPPPWGIPAINLHMSSIAWWSCRPPQKFSLISAHLNFPENPCQHILAALAYYIWWSSKGRLLLSSLRRVGPCFTDPTWSENVKGKDEKCTHCLLSCARRALSQSTVVCQYSLQSPLVTTHKLLLHKSGSTVLSLVH